MRNIEVTGVKTCGLPISEIVDAVNHVQLATNTTPGTSGPGPNPPAFVEGGKAFDGLIWADQGAPPWVPNAKYLTVGAFILDSNGNLETVSSPGISGPASLASPVGTPIPW